MEDSEILYTKFSIKSVNKYKGLLSPGNIKDSFYPKNV